MQKSSKTALGAMVAALSVVIMLLTVVPVLTYTSPAFAGLLIVIIVIELDKKWAFGVYAAVGVLSVLLASDKEAAILYLFFFGYYPILKAIIEGKLKNVFGWIVKFVLFNTAIVACYFIIAKVLLLPMDDFDDFGKYTIPIFLVAGNVVFLLYDLFLTKMVVLYQMKWQQKFRKLFSFKKRK